MRKTQIEDSKVVEVFDFVRDVMERKKTEGALLKSEAEYQLIIENTNDAIVVICDGLIRFFNHKIIDLGGYLREDLISEPFIQFVHPDDRTTLAERYARIIRGEQLTSVYRFGILAKDGRTIWVEIKALLISWEGKPATLNFLTDITKRKRMEEQFKDYSESLEKMVEVRTQELMEAQEKLVRTEKLAVIGQLAGSVGHDLRNPLAAIKTSAYFLKTKLGDTDDDKVSKHLAMLDTQVEVCNNIITDLLDFSRPGRTNVLELDMNQAIEEMVKGISAPENVEVSICIAADLPKVMADRCQLGRVFSNLVSNAIQAMPRGGRLTLNTSESGGFVEVTVTDTGVGIPQENLNKIFEPLFTTKANGTGLGLGIARALVERQGGTIEVESQVGQGTTFTLRLPVIGRRGNGNGKNNSNGS